ncbi:MAG: dUTP diphosphatase [Clostridiales bacterium]|jgi:dUTP pyrophosphatase|nr:dUTP diphosphatase [Clostridiales bacterium]
MNITYTRIPSDNGYVVPEPVRATAGAAGIDLRACIDEPVVIQPGKTVRIPSGIALSLPEDYAAFVFARSGLGVKHGITLANSVGVIDSDYRGEILIGLINLSDLPYTVQQGDRVAQLVIMPVVLATLIEGDIGDTARGSGGFGSTGR